MKTVFYHPRVYILDFSVCSQRRNDREEIRRRLAMGPDAEDLRAERGRKPSLQSRLQSGPYHLNISQEAYLVSHIFRGKASIYTHRTIIVIVTLLIE